MACAHHASKKQFQTSKKKAARQFEPSRHAPTLCDPGAILAPGVLDIASESYSEGGPEGSHPSRV